MGKESAAGNVFITSGQGSVDPTEEHALIQRRSTLCTLKRPLVHLASQLYKASHHWDRSPNSATEPEG